MRAKRRGLGADILGRSFWDTLAMTEPSIRYRGAARFLTAPSPESISTRVASKLILLTIRRRFGIG
ncbi:MAG: hypothetical protein AVDCRST_MAG10-939 [uncultured Acidimicrobiales bacterium]|uniref:Uncharacterized protein n=1 Tax=uncultured Acidimicrobiales bacterium TaxID=310071 RepID=A0A6J4HNE5_9ACTN|nr:MAG: hypothetical protein AVDCRST_MAG10-939 [uncultured Acidimicrobiales bacterium]